MPLSGPPPPPCRTLESPRSCWNKPKAGARPPRLASLGEQRGQRLRLQVFRDSHTQTAGEPQDPCSSAAALPLDGASEPPVESVAARTTEERPQSSCCVGLGWSLRICIPKKFPHDTDATGLWMHFQNHCARGLVVRDRIGTFHTGPKWQIPSDVPLGQRRFESVSKARRRCPLRLLLPSFSRAGVYLFSVPRSSILLRSVSRRPVVSWSLC